MERGEERTKVGIKKVSGEYELGATPWQWHLLGGKMEKECGVDWKDFVRSESVAMYFTIKNCGWCVSPKEEEIYKQMIEDVPRYNTDSRHSRQSRASKKNNAAITASSPPVRNPKLSAL